MTDIMFDEGFRSMPPARFARISGIGNWAVRVFHGGIACVVASAVVLGTPAAAQEDQKAKSDETPAKSVCFANVVKGGAKQGHSFAIAIPVEKADEFTRRGFAPADCAELQPVEGESKQSICEVAAARDFAVNMYFWERFGFTPEEGCKTIRGAKQP